MDDIKKEEKKTMDGIDVVDIEESEYLLDGKKLHDLYRHTTKMIK